MDSVELVIIGDVIKSRKKFDPKEWNHFHQMINKINQEFSSSLKIPLTIYAGDSFGGICDNVDSATKIVLAIQEYQGHHKSRVVLIEDKVAYGLDKKNFLTLEGPALWKSENQLKELKKKSSFFLADLKDELKTIAINTILNLILSIRDGWSKIEWEVYKNAGLEIKQKELALKLGVTQQYISKIIKTSKLKLVNEAETNLISILNGINNYIHKD
ncbi:SatD family protein [Winogradskyella sp.]|uniref:SatD family protein n=1 Tax=Winogradskyella sp. TaxID=1883156 RepID=UPI00262ABC74|nr:SatD family protein [Winogradskyella sp.]